MAKHSRNKNDAPKTVFLAPCDDGTILYNGPDFDSTLTRAFLTRRDALKYAKSLGWPTHCNEGTIIEVSTDCL